ncbi:MAG: vitamin B12-dependent ribonucleotide reductase [Firmicutes bacterium]|nr:vitamin B12-dependent ribonucleotide reductase [Bacillota bacterium]
MNISENAKIVLKKRYLTKDANNNIIDTIEDLFTRVASTIAGADLTYDKNADVKKTTKIFYDMMTEMDFLPNSPTLMNAGKPLGQLSACFVLPVGDSMEEIFETIKHAALIHKSGGGTGFSFSRLRNKGAVVNTTGGVASGPVSFMRVFNAATEAVKQGGTRRGANMGILRVDHPDILEFIDCKKDNADITNFNISIGITEEFMKAVKDKKEYGLIDPKTKKVVSKLFAQDVYNKIVDAAYNNGEPGIIFLDRLNQCNITPTKGEIESTNPCGEQPLLPYESCNLGSINLANMLKETNSKIEIDWDKLKYTTQNAVHFLDNVIDVNKYPLPMIDKTTKESRKIGLGIMGFSDLLLKLNIPYNSEQCIETAKKIMEFINREGREKSNELAKRRGAFSLFKESTLKNKSPTRNATITTIAPTGTLSILASCSSGCEPIFAYSFIKNVMDGTELIEVNPYLKEVLEKRGLYSDDLMKKVTKEGSLAHIKEIPQDIKRVFVCAHDISPEYHIKVQAAFQEFTDNAVSKTVNFSNSATRDDVDKAYKLAYELGCKGVTIYRDGSRSNQVLNIGKVNAGNEVKNCEKCDKIKPRPRPEVVMGYTQKAQIGCGNLYITVNYDDKGIVEVFTNLGKAGGCPSQSEATARLISTALRSGIDAKIVIEQLKGIKCPSTVRQQDMKFTSCPDAIAKVLQEVIQATNGKSDGKPDFKLPKINIIVEGKIKFCPECGKVVEQEGGCVVCRNCGFSKCG